MSKTSIPTTKLSDEECNILFKSITDKLHIENPKFFYPIYKKIIDDETIAPEELRCTVLDSKFKCKEILVKLVDSDEEYDEDNSDEEKDEEKSEKSDGEDCINEEFKHLQLGGEINDVSNTQKDKTNLCNDNIDSIENILNDNSDKNILDSDNHSEESDDIDDDDDDEINEAINNTFMAKAIIERTNKETGEKTCKEEKIHIKKTALLESLKVMNDEYVIPSKIQNKNIDDDTLKNTMSKLNSYNNSGHVESLFLYLGNKLVESGKCPSFPYYYGCINGDDPNYHHNITDEYESVSRNKWFRDRIKTDFDLLIIENDDIEDYQNKALSNFNKTINDCNEDLKGGNLNTNENNNSSSSDSESDSDSDSESDNDTDSNSNSDSDIDNDSENGNESKDKITTEIEIANFNNNSQPIIQSIDFIKDMDNEDLNFNECNDCGECISCIESNLNCSNTDGLEKVICKTVDNEDCNEEFNEECNDDLNLDDDSFIEELSDVDKDNLSLSEFDNNSNNMYFIKCESMPVSLSLMEKLDKTLDDLLDEEYNMNETEWFSVFFQVAFGLAVAQKYFSFVHNDLHSSNVMFKATTMKFLYFNIDTIYYRIPTYGKITKIIDFARGTFKFGDRWVFSDQFKEDNDAFGQYDYPIDGTLKNCEHKPNPSFDLVRLGTTVIQRLDELPKVREFIEQITLDDNDTSLCYDEDTFQLYIDIAHNCHNAVPLNVMARPEFERFKINKNKIPKGQYVFKY